MDGPRPLPSLSQRRKGPPSIPDENRGPPPGQAAEELSCAQIFKLRRHSLGREFRIEKREPREGKLKCYGAEAARPALLQYEAHGALARAHRLGACLLVPSR